MLPVPPIETISAPDRDTFRGRHLEARVPVRIQGLFDGQPISALNTLPRLRAGLGELPLGFCQEYFSVFLESRETGLIIPEERPPLHWMRLGEYLDHIEREPATRILCTELQMPEAVASMLEPPDLVDLHYDAARGIKACVFVANAGNLAHLHFDGDLHHVLLHQVTGRKRVTLFQPSAAKLLLPVLHWGMVCLETMSPAERRAFLAYAGGEEITLHPGETLYIPPLFWHHIEYPDTGFGFNFRFGLDPAFAPMVTAAPDYLLQNVTAELMRRSPLRGADRVAYAELVAAITSSAADPDAWHRRRQSVLESLYAELCPGAPQGLYALPYDDLIRKNVAVQVREPGGPPSLTDLRSQTAAAAEVTQ